MGQLKPLVLPEDPDDLEDEESDEGEEEEKVPSVDGDEPKIEDVIDCKVGQKNQ